MLRFMKGPALGVIACFLWLLNTVVCGVPLLFVVATKIIMPFKNIRQWQTGLLNDIASFWVGCNNFFFRVLINVRYTIVSTVNLKKKDSYLVIANHQSWADIVVLGRVLNGKIPFMKFFLKTSLLYVPILGLAWWALDYPFMKRYSKEAIEKNPALKKKDLNTAQALCEKYKHQPIALMNFVEGSRFSSLKKKQQNSPFKHLLLPRAGGISYALSTLGKQLHSIIDVTIVYPKHSRTLWKMLCGRLSHVQVYLREIPITPDLLGDYSKAEFRAYFQKTLNQWWEEKDALIDQSVVSTQ